MITTRIISFVALLLAAAESLEECVTILNRNLADVRGQALAAWEKASAVAFDRNKHSLRHSRDLQTFADSCGYIETNFEQSG
jgi:hypothetical protein